MSIYRGRVLTQHLENMFNIPDMQIADKIFAADFVAHVPMMPSLSRSSFKTFIDAFYESFPDLNMHTDESIITTNRLVLRITYTGTHSGEFLGIAATNLHISLPTISVFKFEHGVITEGWFEMDIFGLVGQISNSSFARQSPNLN